MEDRDELLDIKQAAELLHVSETSLRRWTNSGQLACLRVGRKRERRFRRAALLAFMEEQPADGAGGGRTETALTPHTGVDRPAVTAGHHLCGLYRSDQGRVRLATAFLLDGLQPDTVCFLLALPAVRTEILAQLEAERPTLAQDIDAGRLLLSEYHDSADAQHDYWQTNFAAALHRGARSLRVLGDLGGFYRTIGARALFDYEAGYDRFVRRTYPVAMLCLYDVRVFSALDILEALKVHADTLQFPADQLLA
jgi:excisionase family DNA binding protein